MLKSGLIPCPMCGTNDLKGHINRMGRCIECAVNDLEAADSWQDAYMSNEEERSHLRNVEIPKLQAEVEGLRDKIIEMGVELRNVMAQRDSLLSRLQWSNVNGGMAHILKGVDCHGISKLMQNAVDGCDSS